MERDKLPIEGVEYLERLVACNRAVGVCVGHVSCKPDEAARLDTTIVTAADYEEVSRRLALPNGWGDTVPPWPPTAAETARQYQEQFPWLLQLMTAAELGGRCPVWEQLAKDLTASEKYLNFVYRRTKTYLPPHVPGTKGRESARTRAVEEFAGVLWETHRIVAGRAAVFLDRARSGVLGCHPTWLDAVLHEASGSAARDVRVTRGLPARKPDKPKPPETPDDKAKRPQAVPLSYLGPHEAREKDQPDRAVEVTERNRLLRERIAALPKRERMTLELTLDQELTQREAAEVMQITVNELRHLLDRARNLLRNNPLD
jgi:RNA polymerase sigma factor (sigma-70 family)